MRPGDGHPFCIEPCGDPVVVVRPVQIVLDVFLATPDYLHGTIPLAFAIFAASHAWPSASSRRPNPPPTYWFMHFRLPFEAGPAQRRTVICVRGGCLRSHPQFAAVALDVHCAIHRLHGRMSEKRKLIDGVQARGRRRKSLVAPSPSLRATTPGCREAISSCRNDLCSELCAPRWRPVVPLKSQRPAGPFLAAPVCSAMTATAGLRLDKPCRTPPDSECCTPIDRSGFATEDPEEIATAANFHAGKPRHVDAELSCLR